MTPQDIKIPNGWLVKSIGQLFDHIYRYPTYYNIEYVESGIPEIRGELLLEDGGINKDKNVFRFISLKTSMRFSKTILKEGDFVISVRGTMGKVGYIDKDLEGSNITANLIRMSPNRILVNPLFIKQVFVSEYFQGQLGLISSQTTIKTIKVPELKSILIKVPPPPEQSKITAILSTVDKAIEKTDELISKYKRIKQGLMQDLFRYGIDENGQIRSEKTHKFKDSPFGRIPEEWKVKRFSELNIEVIDGDRGEKYPTEKELLGDGYCVFLNNKNIENGKFIFDTTQFISEEKDKKLRKGKLFPEDIVITTRGTVGNISYFDKATKFKIIRINSGMIIIRNYQTNFMPIFFLNLWNYIFEKQYSLFQSGSAQPQLPIRILNYFHFIKPEVPEQSRIAYILSQANETIEKEVKYKRKLISLKRGLMEDLLSGKLRVNYLINK